MNFVKFLRVPFLTEYAHWLLLKGRSDFQTKKERESERETERDVVIDVIDVIDVL